MSKTFAIGNQINPIDVKFSGKILDNNGNFGEENQILKSDGNGIIWDDNQGEEGYINLYFSDETVDIIYSDINLTSIYTSLDLMDCIYKKNKHNRIILNKIDNKKVIIESFLFKAVKSYNIIFTSGNSEVTVNILNCKIFNIKNEINIATSITNITNNNNYIPTVQAMTSLVNNKYYLIWQEVARFDVAGNYTWTPSELGTYGFLVVGAGGGGCSTMFSKLNDSKYHLIGGTSGDIKSKIIDIKNTDNIFNISVGEKGSIDSDGQPSILTFNSISLQADGGLKGKHSRRSADTTTYSSISIGKNYTPAVCSGGQPGLYGRDNVQYISTEMHYEKPFNTTPVAEAIEAISNATIIGAPWKCINPFTQEDILGGGGGCLLSVNGSGSSSIKETYPGGKNPITGLGGGDYREDASEFGCGGGAGANGADGAIIIYKAITSI